MTDYREESTFSFDPGKLPLVLLEKGHQQNQTKQMKARKKAMLANRNLATANEFDPQPRQHPHVADLVWALAKSEAAKLELAKQRAMEEAEAAAAGVKLDATPTTQVASVSATASATTNEAKTSTQVGSSQQQKPVKAPRGASVGVAALKDHQDQEDRVELGFSLHISELRGQQGYDNKDCDSGVLFQSTHFASSFNTDVGYSSETSRAPSYPSSVVFKRRTYTNKSVSQNYSSLTESLGSQPAEMEGDLAVRNSPSPLTPMDSDDLLVATKIRRNRHNHLQQPSFNGDPRRLSYKRACDPDKRISLAFDSMLSGDSDLSYGSQVLPPPPQAPASGPSVADANHHHQGRRRSSGDASGSSSKRSQYVTEGTETDDRWLKRRQSYQKSCGRMNHLQTGGQQEPEAAGQWWRTLSLECFLSVLRFVRSILQHVIQSPWMDFFITISIVLNTAFLAAEHHGMSPDVKHVLDVGNKVRPHSAGISI